MPRALAPRAIAGSLARTVALLAVAFVVVAALLTLMQDRLLYHPEPASVAEVAVGGIAAWPSSDDFRGLLIEPVGQHGRAARATVIVFHGNAGHAGHRRWYAEALGPLGLRVLLAEYPGYGPRKGKPGEARLVADAAQTIAAARRAFGEPILLLGESLGAGVAAAAAHAAGPDAGISGLLLVTPWDRLVNVAAFHYPWLPVTWLLKDGYDSAANLASARLPVTVAVATNDGIVPARFGIALHDALPPPKTLLVIEGASHNDWPGRVDADWWRRAIEPLLPLR